MNRTRAVKQLLEKYGDDKGRLYISGPNADLNTTGLVEYNILFSSLNEADRQAVCKAARKFIPGVVDARLTRSYKQRRYHVGRYNGDAIEKGRNIKIMFATRADGSPAKKGEYAQAARTMREARRRRAEEYRKHRQEMGVA